MGAGAIKIRIGAGHTVACPRVWLFLPGTQAGGGSPPAVSHDGAAMGNMGASSSSSDAMNTIAFVADDVWVLTMLPIGKSGLSHTYCVRY